MGHSDVRSPNDLTLFGDRKLSDSRVCLSTDMHIFDSTKQKLNQNLADKWAITPVETYGGTG